MNRLKVGDLVVNHDNNGKYILTGKIIGIKYTSPLGNVYKVDTLASYSKIRGSSVKNIHEKFLKKI